MKTDRELVEATQVGSQEAFAELVARHSQRVFRLALSILGREFEAEAEDVTQEVFLKAYGAIRGFRGEAEFGSWVYRIAFNLAVNLKARVRFRRPHGGEKMLDQLVSAGPGPERQMELRQRDLALAECVGELPEVYQSALRLYYWLGTGMSEVAELLGVPENTAKSYLHRARKLLEYRLKERGFGNE